MKILGRGSSNGSHRHRLTSSFPAAASDKHMRRRSATPTINPTNVIALVIFSITSFYCGTIVGWNVGWNACSSSSMNNGSSVASTYQNCNEVCNKQIMKPNSSNEQSGNAERFSPKLIHWVTGLVSTNRKDMFDTFDFGVPMDPRAEQEDVLLLYNEREAMPSDKLLSHASEYSGDIPHTTPTKATENCDIMNVVFMKKNPGRSTQCVALIGGQYQSYHVQRWQRLIGEGTKGKTDRSAPLRLTSRVTNDAGYDEFTMPAKSHLQRHQEMMKTYLNSLTKIRTELGEILKKIAKNNSVVVMTVNRGQSDLFMNFVCSARARGYNLDHVIVFPTDTFSKNLTESLGLATYYSHELMQHVPEQDSRRYGDETFGAVMIAKVLCVHLVNDLGFDLLFQDVDVFWYRDPLDFFHSADNSGFDVYFQDDGSRQVRFAPYAANSGFYFARSNDRSKLLFRSLLYATDLILAVRSHQQIFTQLLSEHNSLSGLTVKVLSKENTDFPSGFHYHRSRDYMKLMISGEKVPYAFHMCWTQNKEDKVLFMKQMGMWYLRDECVGKNAESLGDVANACCSAEPIIECFYMDKPSVVPCKDFPAKDKGAKSFW